MSRWALGVMVAVLATCAGSARAGDPVPTHLDQRDIKVPRGSPLIIDSKMGGVSFETRSFTNEGPLNCDVFPPATGDHSDKVVTCRPNAAGQLELPAGYTWSVRAPRSAHWCQVDDKLYIAPNLLCISQAWGTQRPEWLGDAAALTSWDGKPASASDAATVPAGAYLVTLHGKPARFHADPSQVRILPEGAPEGADPSRDFYVASAMQLRVSLSRIPPSRVQVSVNERDGRHVDLSFEPTLSLRLNRSVTLQPGWWRVSVAVDPALLPDNKDRPDAWQLPYENTAAVSLHHGRPASLQIKTAGPPASVDLRLERLPKLADVMQGLAVREGGLGGGRSLDSALPEGVNQALQLLAEIAFDRAKARGLRILQEKLQHAVCEDVVLRAGDLAAIPGLYEALQATSPQDAVKGGLPLLPETCRLVKSVRIEELASSGEAALRALSSDLTRFGMLVLRAEIERADLPAEMRIVLLASLDPMAQTLAALTRGERPNLGHQAQLMLTSLAEALTQATRRGTRPSLAMCALTVTVASAAQCQATDHCDTRFLTELVRAPDAHFDLAGSGCALPEEGGEVVKSLRERWPDLPQLVSRFVDVLQPPRGTDPKDTLRSALALLLEITTRVFDEARTQRADLLTGPGLDAITSAAEAVRSASGSDQAFLDARKRVLEEHTHLVRGVRTVEGALAALGVKVATGAAKPADFVDALSDMDGGLNGMTSALEAAAQELAAKPLSDAPWAKGAAAALNAAKVGLDELKTAWVTPALTFAKDRVELGGAQLGPGGAGVLARADQLTVKALTDALLLFTATRIGASPAETKEITVRLGDDLAAIARSFGLLKPTPDGVTAKVDDIITSLDGLAVKVRAAQITVPPVSPERERQFRRLMFLTRGAQGIVKGVLDSDPQPIVASSVELMGHVIQGYGENGDPARAKALKKGVALLAAITSYAQTYAPEADGSEKTAEAQRAARKKAIESLIDAATDRGGREREVVYSLGANVGFDLVGGQSQGVESDEPAPYFGQLSLPMGVARQVLPGRTTSDFGTHLSATFVDLGQFLVYDADGTVESPSWRAFLSPGIQAGFLLNDPEDAFFVGLDARYSPSLFGDSRGAFRGGVFVAYYVPFFDLN